MNDMENSDQVAGNSSHTPSTPTAPFMPSTPSELESIVQGVHDNQRTLRIVGAGTKAGIGRPIQPQSAWLCTLGLAKVCYFEPEEFVLSAQAGAKVVDLQAMLAGHGLTLPFYHAWALGGATLGGAIATNLGGAERLDLGAPRDNVLGVEYVNGQGALLRAGGRVMKNVTGLDLGRALSGSWGRLAVLTEITVKVVPLATMRLEQFNPLDGQSSTLWRVSIPAKNALEASSLFGDALVHQDWNGGLLWVGRKAGDFDDVHAMASGLGGHALRVAGGVGRAFQPRSDGIKGLEERVRSALDPRRIFDSQYDD